MAGPQPGTPVAHNGRTDGRNPGPMSNYDQEIGQWVLPSAEVARTKKVLRDAHNAVAEEAYAQAKRFWKEHGSQSIGTYRQRAEAFVGKLYPRQTSWGMGGGRNAARQRTVAEAVENVLWAIAWQADGGGKALHGATWGDMAQAGWDKATNRTTVFRHGEAVVKIDEDNRTLLWDSGDNNHAVDHAHARHLHQTLFAHLGRIKWTRGTGGTVRYSSEYDTDSHGLNSGSQLTQWHGPRGAEAYKHERGYWPDGSPQAKAEKAKKAKAEIAKRQRAAKAARTKAAKQTQAKAAGSKFCGAIKKDHSGLCGRKITSGKCPDHGTTSASLMIGVTGTGSVVPASAITADPMA